MLDFGFYNMDCLEGMRQFPDKYFDLAIVDPPYGIGASKMSLGAGSGVAPESGYRYKQNRLKGGGKLKDRIIQESTEWDEHPPTKEYFDELMRVSKNQIIWGGGTTLNFLRRGGLYVGIKSNLLRISRVGKWRGPRSINRQKYFIIATPDFSEKTKTSEYIRHKSPWPCISGSFNSSRTKATQFSTLTSGAHQV